LSLCRQLIALLGGSIHAESAGGEFSVTVTFAKGADPSRPSLSAAS
jgi:signal transduction histidine kinase